MQKNTGNKIRLGIFVSISAALFIAGIYFIGQRQQLFGSTFRISGIFKDISGLQVGNNVRFSGINVGTVDNIDIINDTTVRVEMLIKKDVQKFIKTDCEAGIGTAGIIGDRVLIITQGGSEAPMVKDGQHISSTEPVETDAIMASLNATAGNAEIISEQLAEIMVNINSGNGTLGRLIQDSTIANNLSQTMVNIRKSSKGLDENMNAAQHNFLLKGYFNKKAKADEKTKDSIAKIKEKELKENDKKK
jgi:phospholipid/cholesterol/gamma-HCH transport system substrate-binding protein